MSDHIGSVSVEVVPDARGWAEKLRAQIRDLTATVKVDADTTMAQAKIDEATRDRTVNVRVDDHGGMSRLNRDMDGFLGKVRLLPALLIAAGAAAAPLGATVGGAALGAAAPLGIAGVGAGLFGVVAGVQVAQTEKQLKLIAKAQAAVDKAAPGQAKIDAIKHYQDLLKSLTPEQEKFTKAQGVLKGAFEQMANKSHVLTAVAAGMGLLAKVMPLLTPVLSGISSTFGGLANDAKKALNDPDVKRLFGGFAQATAHDIRVFGHIVGNVFVGLSGLMLAFDKHLGRGILDGIDSLSRSFRNFGLGAEHNKGLQRFFDYFHQQGPLVSQTLGDLARAVGHIMRALAPLGPPMLKAIDGFARALNKVPTGVLTTLAGGIIAVTAALKLARPVVAVASKLGGAASVLTGGKVGGAFGNSLGQRVFVTNWPPGFGGGGVPDGGKTSKLGNILRLGGEATVVAAVSASISGAIVGHLTNVFGARNANGIGSAWAGSASGGQMGLPAGQSLDADLPDFNFGGYQGPKGPGNGLRVLLGQTIGVQNAAQGMKASLHAALGKASQDADMTGGHMQRAFGSAQKAADDLRSHIAAIHDKRIQVILQDQAAIQSLEALQRMRIADKSFNVYAHYNAQEQAVGPGGGMGQNPHGSAGGGSGGGGLPTTGRAHITLDAGSGLTLTGVMDHRVDQHQRFQEIRGGR